VLAREPKSRGLLADCGFELEMIPLHDLASSMLWHASNMYKQYGINKRSCKCNFTIYDVLVSITAGY
jgi:hypothetical protein